MNARARWLSGLPLLIGAALLAWVTGAVVAGFALALLVLATCVMRQRWSITRGGEFILAAASIALGLVIGAYLPFADSVGAARGVLGPLASRFALACMLTVASRRWVDNPTGGESATMAVAFGAVVASGSIRPGPIYPWFLACFAAATIAGIAAARPAPVRWWDMVLGRKAASLAAIAFAVTVTLVLAWGLPKLHGRMIRGLGGWQRAEFTGFSDRINLGGEVDLEESDKVVLRIHGGNVDYLRGAAWQRYVRGEWRPWPDRGAESVVRGEVQPDSVRIEIRPEAASTHYFVPTEARQIRTGDGRVLADSAGILSPPRGEEAGEISFSPSSRDAFAVAPPSAADVEVPESIRAELEKIAKHWAGAESSPQGRLAAIEQNLRTGFRYSLHHRRMTRGDPTLDFLLHNRVGHCEYFATAMTLLARSLGIPARVVAGYRVAEHNTLGNYDVVRRWNAHAWVEAWVEGSGWQTWDPTPPSAIAANKPANTPWLGAMLDVVLSGLLTRWLDTPSGPWIVRGGLALVALVVFRKRLVNLVRGSKRARRQDDPDVPPQVLADLLRRLAQSGYVRSSSEPLERFARRLRQTPGMDPVVPDSIERYTRLRYGDEGDPGSIESGLRDATFRISG